MKADLLRSGRSLVLPTLALAFVLAFVPGEAALAARIYALLLCCYALVLALAALRRTLPPTRPLRPATRRQTSTRRKPPETLARLEQEIWLGPFDFHQRLRPPLRELARDFLELQRGVSLDGDPEAARRILGDTTWQLLRPDRPRPDRSAAAIPLSELARVVESLERI